MRARRGEARAFLEAAILANTDDCVLWPFSLTEGGYAAYQGGTAHPLVCSAWHGPAPSAKHESAHSCGMRPCINGKHLRWDTRKGNLADMPQHGTDTRGIKNAQAVLTIDDVNRIRRCAAGMEALAAELGVSLRYCYKVRAGDRRVYDV